MKKLVPLFGFVVTLIFIAIQEVLKTKSPKQLNWAYTAKAQYCNTVNQKDSSIAYAKRALAP